jgi:hypothetical protein
LDCFRDKRRHDATLPARLLGTPFHLLERLLGGLVIVRPAANAFEFCLRNCLVALLAIEHSSPAKLGFNDTDPLLIVDQPFPRQPAHGATPDAAFKCLQKQHKALRVVHVENLELFGADHALLSATRQWAEQTAIATFNVNHSFAVGRLDRLISG